MQQAHIGSSTVTKLYEQKIKRDNTPVERSSRCNLPLSTKSWRTSEHAQHTVTRAQSRHDNIPPQREMPRRCVFDKARMKCDQYRALQIETIDREEQQPMNNQQQMQQQPPPAQPQQPQQFQHVQQPRRNRRWKRDSVRETNVGSPLSSGNCNTPAYWYNPATRMNPMGGSTIGMHKFLLHLPN